MNEGPVDTRGGIRGWCVKRFARHIQSVQWERIEFKPEAGVSKFLDLNNVVEPTAVQALKSTLEGAGGLADVMVLSTK